MILKYKYVKHIYVISFLKFVKITQNNDTYEYNIDVLLRHYSVY